MKGYEISRRALIKTAVTGVGVGFPPRQSGKPTFPCSIAWATSNGVVTFADVK